MRRNPPSFARQALPAPLWSSGRRMDSSTNSQIRARSRHRSPPVISFVFTPQFMLKHFSVSPRFSRLLLVVVALGPLAHFSLWAAERPAALLRTEFLNERAPYPECHASTIVETPAHGLVAAWFG